MRGTVGLSLLALLAIAVVVVLGGCGDDGGGGGVIPPVGTATLTGNVVAADNVALALGQALITIIETGDSIVSQADGSFVLNNLPAGLWTVEAQTPNENDYDTTRVRVQLSANQVSQVNLAILPAELAAPTGILLDPATITVDLNGRVAYRAQVVAGGDVLEGIAPSWVVSGPIGTVTVDGVFTATGIGAGRVTAYAGDINVASTVTVTGPRAPLVSSFQLDPRALPAGGGQAYVSAAINDGDGVYPQDVILEVYGPGDTIQRFQMDVANPGSALVLPGEPGCYQDATFALNFDVPANDNVPSALGVQAEEEYSACITVTDRSGAATTTPFIDFSVRGINAPPPTPNM